MKPFPSNAEAADSVIEGKCIMHSRALPGTPARQSMVQILLAIAVAILVFNLVTWRELALIHPRHPWLRRCAFIACNAMWPFFPILNARTDFSRVIRATLGPPWFSWVVFTLIYSIFIALLRVLWILRSIREPSPFISAKGAPTGAGLPLPLRTAAARRPFPEFARRPERIFLIVLLIAGLAGCWEGLVPLRIERVPITIAGLPPSLEGKRIALMGDLHVGLFTRPSRLQKIFTETGTLRPDVVLLAGDLIDDDPHFSARLLRGAAFLPPDIPLIGVLGNHEMYGAPRQAIANLKNSRIRLLVNEGVAVGDLWVAGISDYAAQTPDLRPDYEAALRGKPAQAMPLLLSHQPKSFPESIARGIPLTLCAHSHGGQLGFRPLRWSLAGLFLPYHMGLYRRGVSQLYVSTGTGYWLVPFRLGMTPEITLIELHSG
jgi:predicted MPP superfamily phosphohydrolase